MSTNCSSNILSHFIAMQSLQRCIHIVFLFLICAGAKKASSYCFIVSGMRRYKENSFTIVYVSDLHITKKHDHFVYLYQVCTDSIKHIHIDGLILTRIIFIWLFHSIYIVILPFYFHFFALSFVFTSLLLFFIAFFCFIIS